MTGFGRASRRYEQKTITIELKALNSKIADIKLKLPSVYKGKEMNIRKIISTYLQRGKVEGLIEVQSEVATEDESINERVFRSYYAQLHKLSVELEIPQGDMISGILRLPNVVGQGISDISDEEWQTIQKTLEDALANVNEFRRVEGASIEEDFRLRVKNIQAFLGQIPKYEQERMIKVKERLRQSLEDLIKNEKVDENRFEQELIYYLEKMDINEEKVRLEQHCKYFVEQLDSEIKQKGRKLNFISQEMGREINTIGSKANNHDIQKLVVKMKDELEKIKEQCANVM